LHAGVVLLDSVKSLRIVSRVCPVDREGWRGSRLDTHSKNLHHRKTRMAERKFAALDGRIWSVRPRLYVRKDETGSNVTLEFASDGEVRVVSCLRQEWQVEHPDLISLLGRSVASGASRNVTPPR
jgi:hypothetical protein